jgi:hypothetical protein
VVFKEYPECEHLFAVQVALSDVFTFFDKIEDKIADKIADKMAAGGQGK